MIDSKATTFRGINDNGEWVFGSFIWTGAGYYIASFATQKKHPYSGLIEKFSFPGSGSELIVHEVDSATIGRIVGIGDKNGRMAFEGDILVPRMEADEGEERSYGHIRFGKNRNDGRTPTCEIGFWVEWEGEDAEYWRNDIGYWLKNGYIIGNEAGIPMTAEIYETFNLDEFYQ